MSLLAEKRAALATRSRAGRQNMPRRALALPRVRFEAGCAIPARRSLRVEGAPVWRAVSYRSIDAAHCGNRSSSRMYRPVYCQINLCAKVPLPEILLDKPTATVDRRKFDANSKPKVGSRQQIARIPIRR